MNPLFLQRGLLAVFGVAMLNGIVLVSFLNEQRGKGLTVRDAMTAAPRCACGRC